MLIFDFRFQEYLETQRCRKPNVSFSVKSDDPLKTITLKRQIQKQHVKITAYSAISKYSAFMFNNTLLWVSKKQNKTPCTLSLLFKTGWEIFQSLENLLMNICRILLIYASLSYDIFCKLQSFKERTARFLSNKKQTQSVLIYNGSC